MGLERGAVLLRLRQFCLRNKLPGGLVGVERAFAILRRIAPRLEEDRALSGDIERVAEAIRSGQFDIGAGIGDAGRRE